MTQVNAAITTPTGRHSRSVVGLEIQKLAQSTRGLSNEEIALVVKHRLPDSNPSAKSVASVLHGLRAAGVELPGRKAARSKSEGIEAVVAEEPRSFAPSEGESADAPK